ncbi:MAG: DHH family phosphoesterase [Candidatus Hodarchaeaceae archaeon]|nr:DHH family phosphoesterase [Candidatus Hodarchaeaceae archaeon]
MGSAEIRRFQRRADDVAEFLKAHLVGESRVRIIAHIDADGIAAAGILARCLYAYNTPFHIMFTRPLKPAEIMELSKEDYDLFIFVDQGSGQIAAIHKFLLSKECDVLILDHHPSDFPEHKNLAYLNPHACGLNGAKDVSAAGAAYSVVEHVDKNFKPLVGLAIVGAVGDRQEFFSGFTGVNEVLVKRAIDLGLIRVSTGLKLIGRSFSQIAECLRLSIRPYLPSISSDPTACYALVESLDISPKSTIDELGQEMEGKLGDALLARVGQVAADENFRYTLLGTVYTLTKGATGPRDVRDQVAMLDACGKFNKAELGFAVTVGDQVVLTEALALLRIYQEHMVGVLRWLTANIDTFRITPHMRCIYAEDAIEPTMIGEALSLAMESGIIATDRPVIGLVDAGAEELKVSARATPGLAMRGANVGLALARAAEAVGGEGGGHDVSAAARIPRRRMDEFTVVLDRALAGNHGA